MSVVFHGEDRIRGVVPLLISHGCVNQSGTSGAPCPTFHRLQAYACELHSVLR